MEINIDSKFSFKESEQMNLKDFSINRVIIIDDTFINNETLLEELPKEVLTLVPFEEILMDYIENQEFKTLTCFFQEENISEEQQAFFFENINKNYQYFISESGDVEIHKYLPDKFTKEIVDELKMSKDSILFVVDKKLSDRNYENKLRDILIKIAEILQMKRNSFLFIYTTEVESINSYEELNDYLRDVIGLSNDIIKEISLHINFVEKTNGLDDFAVSTAIRKSQKANFLHTLYSVQTKAIDSMNLRIWEINNNELLIHYNYLSEGQHIDEILLDIYQLKFSNMYKENFIADYKQTLSPLRKSMHSYIQNNSTVKEYPVRSRIIKDLNKEFEKDTMLRNRQLSDDISYGDIIQIGIKYYLVCSQQCDLTIRADGYRVDKDILLLEIKKENKQINAEFICDKISEILSFSRIEKEHDKKNFVNELLEISEFKSLINNNTIISEIYNYFNLDTYTFQNQAIRSTYEYFDYKKKTSYSKIPAFILDAILMSNDEEAIEITEQNIYLNLDIRYSTKLALLKGFKSFKNKFDTWNEKANIKDILGEIIFPGLEIEINEANNKLEGLSLKNISRIGRLDIEDATSIHQAYIKDLTRIAKNEVAIF